MSRPRRGALALALLFILLPIAIVVYDFAWYQTHYRHNGSMVFGGQPREYELHVPPTYDPSRPTPLVLSLHGAGGWGTMQKDISGWNGVADRHGVIVAYPSGHGGSGPKVWSPEDVPFIGALIDSLQRAFNIDPDRIYVNGFSNGGGESYVLACTIGSRIAAIGLVGAARIERLEWCPDKRPTPLIDFHGTHDPAADYKGGKSWVGPVFPDVERWDARWAIEMNRCAPRPAVDTVAHDVIRRSYAGCIDAADVVLYTILGGGHTWPGGAGIVEWAMGGTTTSIDASEEMWKFFARHPRHR